MKISKLYFINELSSDGFVFDHFRAGDLIEEYAVARKLFAVKPKNPI